MCGATKLALGAVRAAGVATNLKREASNRLACVQSSRLGTFLLVLLKFGCEFLDQGPEFAHGQRVCSAQQRIDAKHALRTLWPGSL